LKTGGRRSSYLKKNKSGLNAEAFPVFLSKI